MLILVRFNALLILADDFNHQEMGQLFNPDSYTKLSRFYDKIVEVLRHTNAFRFDTLNYNSPTYLKVRDIRWLFLSLKGPFPVKA